ncbi:murein DD-endopeptidase MepM [Lachnospiraceae bacterium]|jgi:murein DD-endopeptidase MepM/ murein hydrolase activator NlpD|nr:peptidoglycan DD-metalloendopeptidase family protein [Lachnospiraceae bacterium]GFI17378.1 murein DD-endopeptidase MepM [Lachnospiraceae bacterium]GFI69394.1 murein DD-endopeptidase MepM [Lachnospiraceae bacterium]
MKRLKKALCLVLSLLLVMGVTGKYGTTAFASELTNDSIRQKEAEINKAKEEKQALQSGLTNVKELKKQLEASKADLANYVAELDANLQKIQAKIDELKRMISEKEEQIEIKTQELEEALEVQQAQYEAMKTRIRFMYERGDTLFLELILGSGSFGEMLNKADYIEMLSSYDRKMLDEYVAYAEYVALCREGLEEEKKVLDEAKIAVEEEEASLNELIADKEQEMYKMSSDIQSKEAAIREYEAEIAAQNDTIKALEAAVAEERKRLAEEQRRRYDGGVFTWPAPSYTRISDEYGNRTHPILGIQQFHNGLDMAAPGGSPILAAYSGTVVAATYSGSMGNYIMIDHGDSLYTIYMHASALYVSKGQEVTKGEKIAAVGSTGRSTGNHLHFSVRLNGNYVSPWNYLRG